MIIYKRKRIEWSKAKNNQLVKNRLISFETVVTYISNENIIKIIKHPNLNKYGHQKIFIINIESYIYLVLYVEDAEKIFLKTIIPSRKYTKLLIKKIQ